MAHRRFWNMTAAIKWTAGALFAGAFLAACSSTPSGGPVVAQPDRPDIASSDRPSEDERTRYDRRGFIEPLHMQGEEPVRVALLLPFSASTEAVQKIASAMFDAAQLAAFETGNARFLLIPKDTKGNPTDAAAAARSALADGAVTLTVGRRAGPPALLRFEVADDGPGVAPEVAKTLFEPFGAVTPGRGATSGSGLGLAISRRLVTAMGGSIGMAGHRGGATFWVELPLAVAKAPSPTARLSASRLALAETPGALRCLAVDDDTVSLFVTLEHLRRLGIEASQAGTMRAALALADRQDFDLFVLDYHLADGDGVDLLAELRRRGKIHSGARAVALTANAELIAAQGGGVAQFDAIIAKPANADALRRALREENAKAGEPPGPWLEGVSPGIVRAMVDAFENQWDSDHSAFVAALDTHNPAEAAQIAHRLAGSCAALGFADIAEALKGFEASCRCGLQPPEFTLWQQRLMPILAAAPARAMRLAETQALP